MLSSMLLILKTILSSSFDTVIMVYVLPQISSTDFSIDFR